MEHTKKYEFIQEARRIHDLIKDNVKSRSRFNNDQAMFEIDTCISESKNPSITVVEFDSPQLQESLAYIEKTDVLKSEEISVHLENNFAHDITRKSDYRLVTEGNGIKLELLEGLRTENLFSESFEGYDLILEEEELLFEGLFGGKKKEKPQKKTLDDFANVMNDANKRIEKINKGNKAEVKSYKFLISEKLAFDLASAMGRFDSREGKTWSDVHIQYRNMEFEEKACINNIVHTGIKFFEKIPEAADYKFTIFTMIHSATLQPQVCFIINAPDGSIVGLGPVAKFYKVNSLYTMPIFLLKSNNGLHIPILNKIDEAIGLS